MMALVEDIVGSVVSHGFRRILIVNGHGGNDGVIDVLASTLGHRTTARRGSPRLTYFQLAREAIAELRESRARRHGPCLRVRDGDDAAHPAGAGGDRAGRGRPIPIPARAYLTTDLLGGSAVRTYHDFGDLSPTRHARRSVARDAREGRRVLRAPWSASSSAFIEDFRGWTIPEARQ